MEHQPPKVNGPEPEQTDPNEPQSSDEPLWSEGLNNLLTGLSSLVETEKFVQAVGHWIEAHADDVKNKAFNQWRNLATSAAFSLLVFGGICVMAWFDKIPKEATVTLLGSLIGYWFGRGGNTKHE